MPIDYRHETVTDAEIANIVSRLGNVYALKSQTQAGAVDAPTPLAIFTVQPADSAKGTFISLVHGTAFSGTWDEVWSWGYNYGAGGSIPVAAEPSFVDQLETSYNDGTRLVVERFWQYGPPNNAFSGSFIRPIFFSYNRAAATRSAATITAQITAPILTFSYPEDGGTDSPMATLQRNTLSIAAPNTGADSLIQLLSATGRNSSVQIQASGTTSHIFGTNGINAAYFQVGANIPLNIGQKPGGGAAGGWMCINGTDNSAALTVMMTANPTNIAGIVVRGKVGGTTRMFAVQDENSVERLFVSKATVAVPPNLVIGNAVLATTATDGFLYLPTCAGTPTGVPTTFTGTKAVIYDTTGDKLWVYNGSWKGVVLA
jgi:hypothetical protein